MSEPGDGRGSESNKKIFFVFLKAPGSDDFCDWGSGPLGVGNVLELYMLLYTPPLFTRSLSSPATRL